MKRGRKPTPYKDGSAGRGRRRHGGLASSRRRESLLFSRERGSLIDPDYDDDGGTNNGLLPFLVTINPGEYASPSSSSLTGSISTLGTNLTDDAGCVGGGNALDGPTKA